jgi:hypothetical protein
VGELPPPTDVKVTPSLSAGSADLSWKSDRGAKAFAIERAEDGPVLDFRAIGYTTQKAASLNSMVSGRKYWFRITAIGTAGPSAWSEPVALFAP